MGQAKQFIYLPRQTDQIIEKLFLVLNKLILLFSTPDSKGYTENPLELD